VYLYEAGNLESLEDILSKLETNNYSPKKPPEEMRRFALANTWEKRIDSLQSYLNTIK
jgi:hypothetical protein